MKIKVRAPLSCGVAVRLGVLAFRVCVLGVAVAATVAQHGFRDAVAPAAILEAVQAVALLVYWLDIWVGTRWLGRVSLPDAKPDWIDGGVLFLGLGGLLLHFVGRVGWGWPLVELATVALVTVELWRLNVGLSRRFHRPGILFPLSFLVLITVGTLLLKLPLVIPPGQEMSWLDALFTMTSAVCMTGLQVRDTATQFTPFGQAVICVFLQLGELGIIVFGSMLAMLMGNQLSLREGLSLSRMLNDLPLQKIDSFVRFIVLGTFLIELAGAAAMILLWPSELTMQQRVGLSLFHAISAFCNAGFSLMSDSLESYRYSMLTHCVILPLIVVGGLGFSVLENVWQSGLWRWRLSRLPGRAVVRVNRSVPIARSRLTLHSRLVLMMTTSLYLYGVAVLFVGQVKPSFDRSLNQGITANRAQPPPLTLGRVGAILADASFMTVSARTAGFNSVPMDEISPAGQFGLITLMMVGASPGGMGGGMKTTTLAVLLLAIWATVRHREQMEVFHRQLHEGTIRKAATIAAAFVALVVVSTLLLTLSEPYPFIKILFEVVSAASTTGLSLGITPGLTAFGKIVIIATMFLGRVGPLAILGALLFGSGPKRLYSYPHEAVPLA